MNAPEIRLLEEVTKRDFINYQDMNTLLLIANALILAQAGDGLSLQIAGDRAILSAVTSGDDQADVNDIASDSSSDLQPIDYVQPGETIDPDTFNACVHVANVFASMEAGDGISIVKSDYAFVFELAPGDSTDQTTAGTFGAIPLADETDSPFIPAGKYNRVVKIFNALIRSYGQNGLEFSFTSDRVLFELGDTGRKTIAEFDGVPAAKKNLTAFYVDGTTLYQSSASYDIYVRLTMPDGTVSVCSYLNTPTAQLQWQLATIFSTAEQDITTPTYISANGTYIFEVWYAKRAASSGVMSQANFRVKNTGIELNPAWNGNVTVEHGGVTSTLSSESYVDIDFSAYYAGITSDASGFTGGLQIKVTI